MKNEESKNEESKNENIKKNDKKKNAIQLVLMLLCFGVFLACVIYLCKYYLEIRQTQDGVQDLKDLIVTSTDDTDASFEDAEENQKTQYVDIDGQRVQVKFEQLYRQNPDFIGWITIADTKVDYPVMQSLRENEYYIHRNFEQSYDSSGLPFLDYRCDFQKPTSNMLIYGHNMKAGTMFSQIMKYSDQDFYETHKTFTFDTIEEDGEYEVVAAFYSQIYPEEDQTSFKYYEFFDASEEEEFDNYVNHILALSTIQTGVVPEYGDSLITLSTCAYHTEDGRFAVVARKIKESN